MSHIVLQNVAYNNQPEGKQQTKEINKQILLHLGARKFHGFVILKQLLFLP